MTSRSSTRRYELLEQHQVPSSFHEWGIKSGYRKPQCSLVDCVSSAFRATNETLNFWTHFLPFWYFALTLRQFWLDEEFRRDEYHWPFLAYLCTACVWPAVSCLAHLFSVMSENARHICFFVDYLSLSWYSFGVAVVYHAYAFDSAFFNTWYSSLFLWITAFGALFCTTLACYTRFMTTPKTRKFLRVVAFFVPYVVVNFPLLERIIHCEVSGCSDAAIPQHELHLMWAAISLLLYGFHFPESLLPGQFDIVGHSHQIFHVCAIFATYQQLWGCHTDMISRRNLMAHLHALPRGARDAGMVCALLAILTIVVVYFICRLLCQRVEVVVVEKKNAEASRGDGHHHLLGSDSLAAAAAKAE